MIDLHNAGPLIAEVTRLREEVADLRAIDTAADEFVDALMAAWPAEDGPAPTAPMEAARYGLRRHLRRLREEVAALKAERDEARLTIDMLQRNAVRAIRDKHVAEAEVARLYDATGFDVDGIIAHDEAMDVQVAALKAEAQRLRLDATNARSVATEALDFHEALRRTAGRPPTCARTDDLRARLATPDPAAFVARPLADYHEDDGNVLWWKFPINEPPYVGSTLDDDWPGYHTHWTPMPPCPVDPALLALGGVR